MCFQQTECQKTACCFFKGWTHSSAHGLLASCIVQIGATAVCRCLGVNPLSAEVRRSHPSSSSRPALLSSQCQLQAGPSCCDVTAWHGTNAVIFCAVASGTCHLADICGRDRGLSKTDLLGATSESSFTNVM
ncbi:hypothetical protein SKAU_G00361200 [Synaphobranchus kaupii]|uniref:Uncharacterized protein n=1 Tax=Synaphobranchus kaupii TaxID=118154 RepID=A0A9Q1EI95_SYNKA|nr:hypothetical protein SKAU_G00361200 [Synaphobranchus kaupii]